MEKKEKDYLRIALERYRLGTATADEIAFLEKYYAVFEEKESFFASHDQEMYETLNTELKSAIDQEINRSNESFSLRPWVKYFAAASVLLILSISIYLTISQKPYQRVSKTNDFAAGSDKAILKLGDGTEILLDTATNGAIVQLDGLTITKNDAGEIEYKTNPTFSSDVVTYNTITIPNGGKYHVVLPDGSNVWLNAASSLRYPTIFKGKERQVEITGEGYFEVTKNKEMPFIVSCRNQKITVLGTHFNINSYEDEDGIKTTLLEGSVKVETAKDALLIKPGEQAYLNSSNLAIQKKAVDIAQETAWKDNLFSFKGDDVQSIMRQVSRWYDVEISYQGNITDQKFYGEISRTSKLSEVFAILELNNVHFKSKGRKIIVSSEDN
ncbi:FecR family protein [Pedobacter insulae]|uniref:FecR protein n=1 Tax=Pedobacter insulae TaxID=414048 RepID=A0A1I2Z8C4_9SPHI|nr:FecR family protein [Pedobacter insulae]SFH34044.1 FecR protein [Pedobacter insulae]